MRPQRVNKIQEMAKKTAEESQRTRDLILDAAERVLTARGVSAATINHIADAAGVSRGAVYGHYRNKTDVALAMCKRAFDRIVFPQPRAGESPLAQLLQSSLDFLELARGSSSLQRVFEVLYIRCEPSADNQPLLRVREALEAASEQNMRLMLDSAITAGELPASLDKALACAFLQSLVGGVYNALTRTTQLDAVGAPGMRALLEAGMDTLRHSQCLRVHR